MIFEMLKLGLITGFVIQMSFILMAGLAVGVFKVIDYVIDLMK